MDKKRIDSKDEAVRYFMAANREIVPPAHVPLDADDLPFFASVISEFAKADWSDHQIELAAMLARMMSDLEREQRGLRAEGSLIKTDRGTPIINPRKTVVQMLSGSILSMRRSLALHARAHEGGKSSERIGKRKSEAKDIEAMASDVMGEDLIARPQ